MLQYFTKKFFSGFENPWTLAKPCIDYPFMPHAAQKSQQVMTFY